MLSAVNGAHLLPLRKLHLLAVLSSLEPVKEVVPKRLVEVEAQARGDFCCEAGGGDQLSARGQRGENEPAAVGRVVHEPLEPLLENGINVGIPRELDELSFEGQHAALQDRTKEQATNLHVLRDGLPVIHELSLEHIRDEDLDLWPLLVLLLLQSRTIISSTPSHRNNQLTPSPSRPRFCPLFSSLLPIPLGTAPPPPTFAPLFFASSLAAAFSAASRSALSRAFCASTSFFCCKRFSGVCFLRRSSGTHSSQLRERGRQLRDWGGKGQGKRTSVSTPYSEQSSAAQYRPSRSSPRSSTSPWRPGTHATTRPPRQPSCRYSFAPAPRARRTLASYISGPWKHSAFSFSAYASLGLRVETRFERRSVGSDGKSGRGRGVHVG